MDAVLKRAVFVLFPAGSIGGVLFSAEKLEKRGAFDFLPGVLRLG